MKVAQNFWPTIGAVTAMVLLLAGCGDHRPTWREANLPKSPISLMPPGVEPANILLLSAGSSPFPIQVAGPSAAARPLAKPLAGRNSAPAPWRPLVTLAAAHRSTAQRSTAPTAAPTRQLAEVGGRAYFVQIGAYRSRATSEDKWRRLAAAHPALLAGEAGLIVRHDFGPPKGLYYQIQAGPFVDRAGADARCAALKAANVDCFVVHTRLDVATRPAAGPAIATEPPAARKARAGGRSPTPATPTGSSRAVPPPAAPPTVPEAPFIRSTLAGIDDD